MIVFAYDFPHQKTVEGLHLLGEWGENCVVIAQPKKTLHVNSSPTRVTPKGLQYQHPREVANLYGFDYHVADHDGEDCRSIVRHYGKPIGIILGSRILKQPLIECCSGIVNAHPGLLPFNRGLDNLKWAVLLGIPQGVTWHFIDRRIDWGLKLKTQVVDVFPDDTPLDVYLRTLNVQLHGMNRVWDMPTETLPPWDYRSAVSIEQDAEFNRQWRAYCESYPSTVEHFLNDAPQRTRREGTWD